MSWTIPLVLTVVIAGSWLALLALTDDSIVMALQGVTVLCLRLIFLVWMLWAGVNLTLWIL